MTSLTAAFGAPAPTPARALRGSHARHACASSVRAPRLAASSGNDSTSSSSNAASIPGQPPQAAAAAASRDSTRSRLVVTREEDAAQAEPNALPVDSSPALVAPRDKYLFPMRADNTEVFFDHGQSDRHTLMVVFANDHHGLVLDVISVLKALGVKCWRIASSRDDALRVMMGRIEGELVSVRGLDLHVDNCYAFWITDEETGEKINDDPDRLEQITACTKLELSAPNPRPTPVEETSFHRVIVEHNRANKFTVFNVQTADRPKLLMELTAAFAVVGLDVCSAAIQTTSGSVENSFFVRNVQGRPLSAKEIENAVESIMRSLLRVGNPSPHETLWYQVRNGSAVSVAEALFIDQVCNSALASFAKFETPNFRGRLPEAPYQPVSLE